MGKASSLQRQHEFTGSLETLEHELADPSGGSQAMILQIAKLRVQRHDGPRRGLPAQERAAPNPRFPSFPRSTATSRKSACPH